MICTKTHFLRWHLIRKSTLVLFWHPPLESGWRALCFSVSLQHQEVRKGRELRGWGGLLRPHYPLPGPSHQLLVDTSWNHQRWPKHFTICQDSLLWLHSCQGKEILFPCRDDERLLMWNRIDSLKTKWQQMVLSGHWSTAGIYQSDIFPIDFNTFHTSIENIQYSLKTKESLAYLKVSQFRLNFEAGYEEAFSKAIWLCLSQPCRLLLLLRWPHASRHFCLLLKTNLGLHFQHLCSCHTMITSSPHFEDVFLFLVFILFVQMFNLQTFFVWQTTEKAFTLVTPIHHG